MDSLQEFTTAITVLDLTETLRKNVTATKIESNLDIVPNCLPHEKKIYWIIRWLTEYSNKDGPIGKSVEIIKEPSWEVFSQDSEK